LNDLSNHPFDKLWRDFWNGDNKKNYDKHFEESKLKFESLTVNNKNVLREIIEDTVSKLKYNNEEWGFPKGRKNLNENEYECALREFYEETGINTNLIKLLDNVGPIKEEYIGTNGVRYIHIYFIGICNDNITPLIDSSNKLQCNEVGGIGFYKLNNTLSLIRPYQIDRLNIIVKLYIFVINYLEIEPV
jgi:ADP-ribose pyrophosphatase YjhB (NUDIX family)